MPAPARHLPAPPPPGAFSFPYERVLEKRVAALIVVPGAAVVACVLSVWVGLAVLHMLALPLLARAILHLRRAIDLRRAIGRRDVRILAGTFEAAALFPTLRPGEGAIPRIVTNEERLRCEGVAVVLSPGRPLFVSRARLRPRDPRDDDDVPGLRVHVLAAPRRLRTPDGPFRSAPTEGPTFEPLLVTDVPPAELRGPALVRAVVGAIDGSALLAMLAGGWALALAIAS